MSKLFVPKFFIPLTILLWLLASLSFMLVVSSANAQSSGSGCASSWSQAMSGVYSPNRLSQETLCQPASGTVTNVEKWSDGDYDIYAKLDSGSSSLVSARDIRNLQKWSEAKKTKAHPAADMIWEIVAQDQGSCSNSRLPTPSRGDYLQVNGAYVYDTNHGYHEIHPIYQEADNGQTCTSSNY